MTSPQIILRGSPVTTGELKHPTTGTTVDEAIRRKMREEYSDARSPDSSPIVTYLPRLKYDELKSPMISTPKIGPGLTPKLSSSVKGLVPSPRERTRNMTPRHEAPSHLIDSHRETSHRVNSVKKKRIVVVDDNGDGTYSPVVNNRRRRDDDYDDYYDQPPPGKFDHLSHGERMMTLLVKCREIRTLAEKYSHLGLEAYPDDGSVPLEEVDVYLEYAQNTIAKEQRFSILELGLEAVYNVVAYVMEKMLNIPMKPYFDNLKGKIRDYRNLLADNTDVTHFVNTVMPSIAAPKTSLMTIAGVFFGQIAIGCIGAGVAAWWGAGPLASGPVMGFASVASNQLDGFMFRGKGAWDMISEVIKKIPVRGAQTNMQGGPVDV